MDVVLSIALVVAAAASAVPEGESAFVQREPIAWPVCSRLGSAFGYRVDPFTGRVAFHSGLDIVARFGATVVAAEAGSVLASERRGAYGLMVEIDHGNGWRTRYGQLKASAVKPGQIVARGETIAEVGSSGRSTGPHLHFEIWFNDVVRDPAKYVVAAECAAADINRSSQPER